MHGRLQADVFILPVVQIFRTSRLTVCHNQLTRLRRCKIRIKIKWENLIRIPFEHHIHVEQCFFLNDCLDILVDIAVFLIRDNHTVPRSADLARYIVQRIAGSGGNADHMRDIILLLHQKVQRSCCKDAAVGPSFQYDCSGFCYAVIFCLIHSPALSYFSQ